MTIITLRCSDESNERLREYLQENGLSGKRDFHSTLFYNEDFPFFEREDIREELLHPIIVDPLSYYFRLLGENNNILGLCYQSSEIERLIGFLSGEAVRQMVNPPEEYSDEEWEIMEAYRTPKEPCYEGGDFGWRHFALKKRRVKIENPLDSVYLDSQLHVTLAKEFQGRVEDLPLPDFGITFDDYRWIHQETL